MHFEFLELQKLTPAAHRAIEQFLDSQKTSHPFQFPGRIKANEVDSRGATYCAILRDKDEIVWFALCGVTFPAGHRLKSVRSLTVNRGPACDDPELALYGLSMLVEQSRAQGFSYIEIAPDWIESPEWNVGASLSSTGWQAVPGRRSSLRLPMAAGNDELLASFRKATRYEIRRSEQQGVAIRPALNDSDAQEFQRIYSEMAEQKNFAPEESTQLSHELRWIVSQNDRGVLLLAFKDASLLGGTLVIRAAGRSWYVLGATTKKDSHLSAGHLLQWHAIQWAKEQGCSDYDFGGYREGVNTGPPLFKRGFCQSVVQFSPAYRYPLKRVLYSILKVVTTAGSK